MRTVIFIALCLSLTGCNSVYMKPGTLDTNQTIYTPRGGATMQRSLKEVFDKRGYKTHVGQLASVRERISSDLDIYSQSKDIRYSIIIDEKDAILRPIWCAFNGFWWWRFSLAISDRKTGTEILSWRGRGCANSSLRKLNAILDELEMKTPNVEQKPAQPKKKVARPNKQNTELLILAK